MEEYIFVKLISGDEIIGQSGDGHTEHEVHLEKPMVLYPASQNQLGIGYLLPYTKIKDLGVDINRSCISIITEPTDALVEEYKKATSPIIRPNLSLVNPGN